MENTLYSEGELFMELPAVGVVIAKRSLMGVCYNSYISGEIKVLFRKWLTFREF
jgi:hypothetical protein